MTESLRGKGSADSSARDFPQVIYLKSVTFDFPPDACRVLDANLPFRTPPKIFSQFPIRANFLIGKHLPKVGHRGGAIFRPKALDIPGKDGTLFLHAMHLVLSYAEQDGGSEGTEPAPKCPVKEPDESCNEA